MEEAKEFIPSQVGELTGALPFSLMESLATCIERVDWSDWPLACSKVLAETPHPNYRALVGKFLEGWHTHACSVSPQSVAVAMRTAAYAGKLLREGQSVELVWTGPDTGEVSLRHTEQALLQVINSAIGRLTVVSYAVYNIPNIRDALVRAAERGVTIKIVVETPDRLQSENAYDTLRALGHVVSDRATVYFWPFEKREHNTPGKPGILHVKCAVADGRSVFLSSANLTEYAFRVNMELGVLISGGNLPGQVERHLYRLIEADVLVPVIRGQEA